VFVVCCVSSGLCYGLITHPEEAYRVCIFVCDLETSTIKRPGPDSGSSASEKENIIGIMAFIQLTYFALISYVSVSYRASEHDTEQQY
jgi:hypothetical protein